MSSSDGGRIVTFVSIHYALAAEKAMKAGGLCPLLIPVPREISSDCGFCILVEPRSSGAEGEAGLATFLSTFAYESVYRVSLVDRPGSQRKEKQYELEHRTH